MKLLKHLDMEMHLGSSYYIFPTLHSDCCYLRNAFHPEVNSNELPPHVYVRSIHNISIKKSWLRLRLDWGNNAVQIFKEGIQLGLYNPNNKDEL